MLFGILNLFKKKEDIDYSVMNLSERIGAIKDKKIDSEVIDYVRNILKELTIHIADIDATDIFTLMESGELYRYAFETAETISVFFNDEDIVMRGYIKAGTYKEIFHSWLCFTYDGDEYILDPALNVLAYKDLYDEIFETTINGRVRAISVKKMLIDQMLSSKKNKEVCKLSSPLYDNPFRYEGMIVDKKIKSLIAHYEYN